MKQVRPKKALGQHFLNDQSIAKDIVDALSLQNYNSVLEIGPGMGVLTQYLIHKDLNFYVIEIDKESVQYLHKAYPKLSGNIIEGDFLEMDLSESFSSPVAIIGNFPYNISSQIFFKVLEHKDLIPEVVGMLQKEVAQRLASPPGSKDYGILSVFLQAYYDIEYLFTVEPHVFNPPPKVRSAVIRIKRNSRAALPCDEKMFFKVVKQSFQMRRKTLRNALKVFNLAPGTVEDTILDKRAEQLSVDDFIDLTLKIQK